MLKWMILRMAKRRIQRFQLTERALSEVCS
jgi:hypothetical protein